MVDASVIQMKATHPFIARPWITTSTGVLAQRVTLIIAQPVLLLVWLRSRCARRKIGDEDFPLIRLVFGLISLLLLPSVLLAADKNPPQINYMLHCQGCHLPGGIGHPGLVPNMQGHIGRFLKSDTGRAYLVQVPGAAQSDLDDGELADVINWLLPEFDPANVAADFKRFTSDEVSRYRSTQLLNVSEVRRQVLSEQSP